MLGVTPLLELSEVTRTVKLPDDQDLHILTGVSLSVHPGDHVGIIGRSGTGKSTLLNLLGLLDRPTTGTLRWAEHDVRRLSQRVAARIRGRDVGFVFQQFNLLPGRTALENVAAPLMYATGKEFWNRNRLAARMLERVGLGERLNSMPEKLSGGEQQRVAIARALVRGPKVVLADEPTGALDVETGTSVMNLLDGVTHETGAALITITHDINIAQMARRRFRLTGGRLVALREDGE
ncbi:ABC transporter ATP-binding protein [Saxibacter everestensis]|uniref:ABC transporter ATP-binding protein n=1 Tax=Saxibacter everestensis TaxID=2909229 RepID=A0ABY8QYQ7_9MICO|nr:ABC transporter ATP-binding protein [Brevibacteriaceae bacterium ZFBP1038]